MLDNAAFLSHGKIDNQSWSSWCHFCACQMCTYQWWGNVALPSSSHISLDLACTVSCSACNLPGKPAIIRPVLGPEDTLECVFNKDVYLLHIWWFHWSDKVSTSSLVTCSLSTLQHFTLRLRMYVHVKQQGACFRCKQVNMQQKKSAQVSVHACRKHFSYLQSTWPYYRLGWTLSNHVKRPCWRNTFPLSMALA